MKFDFDIVQKVRAISPSLISLWVAPRNAADRSWRDLCGRYDAAMQYWNGSAYVAGQNFSHARGRIGGRGVFAGTAGASDRTSAVAYSGGGIITSRGLFKTSWTITACINVNTANGASGGRSIYCERAGTGNDILKLECLNSFWGSAKIGATMRNDGGTLLQWFPTNPKGIISNRWHFVSASLLAGVINVRYNGMSYSSLYAGSDTFTNSGVQTWLCADIQDPASLIGYADAISVHAMALNEGQLAGLERLFCDQIYSFDQQFPYELLVGEAPAGATFQPAWASQQSRILGGGFR